MKLSYLLPEKYAVLKKGKISTNLRPVLYCTYKLKNNDNNNNNNNKLKKKRKQYQNLGFIFEDKIECQN